MSNDGDEEGNIDRQLLLLCRSLKRDEKPREVGH